MIIIERRLSLLKLAMGGAAVAAAALLVRRLLKRPLSPPSGDPSTPLRSAQEDRVRGPAGVMSSTLDLDERSIRSPREVPWGVET